MPLLNERRRDELEVRDADPVDQALTSADEHGEDPDVQLVEQPVLDQRPRELAGAVLEQVPAVPLLQLRDRLDRVALERPRVPGQIGQRPRRDVLRHRVDLVRERVARPLRPRLGEPLVRLPAESSSSALDISFCA